MNYNNKGINCLIESANKIIIKLFSKNHNVK